MAGTPLHSSKHDPMLVKASVPDPDAEWGAPCLQKAASALLQYRPLHLSLRPQGPSSAGDGGGISKGEPGPDPEELQLPEGEEEGDQGLMSSVALPAAQAHPVVPEAVPPGSPFEGSRILQPAGGTAQRPDIAGIQVAARKKRKAAVLVAMFQGPEGEVRVWLTRRSGHLSSHSGEVALPGGKRDETDLDDAETALREAEEEIGLPRGAVRVVTHLEPFLSKHLLQVTPVVAVMPNPADFEPRPNPGEVDSVFSVPLSMFLEHERHTHEDHEWLGLPYRVHFFQYSVDHPHQIVMSSSSTSSEHGSSSEHGTSEAPKGFTIWGLTAAILVRVSCVVFGRSAPFGEFHPGAPNYATVLADLAKRQYLDI